MRPVLWGLAAIGALVVAAAVLAGGDAVFGGGRLLGALLGHQATVAACTPALDAKLHDAGFEPYDLELGPQPDFSGAPGIDRGLRGSFTFQDGAAGSRVDGVMACLVKGQTVTVEFRTRSSPVRAG